MNNYCLVGSTNPIKLDAIKRVISPLLKVNGIEVDTGVSKQPKTVDETINGALQRALALPGYYEDRETARVGLEAGVTLIGGKLFLINWGVLIVKGQILYAGGTQIELPDSLISPIYEEGLELNDAMERYFGLINPKHKKGAIAYFTADMVKRVDIFEHIAKLLFGQALQRGLLGLGG